ncbi:putative transposase subunit [Vibrio cholerae]|nr:putative transposase subunit [Vibrio cholerae]GIB55772.1 putative transposase subunit [Vibrio cholerae]
MNALNDQLKTLRLSHAAKALEQQPAPVINNKRSDTTD